MPSRLEEFRFARWAMGLNRVGQVLLGLLLVGALNYIAARHFERWDLTANHHYSLSPETLAYLETIPREANTPVRLTLTLPENQNDEQMKVTLRQIRALLNEYAYAARGLPGGAVPLQYEEVSIYRNTTRAKELAALGLKQDTIILVTRGDRPHALTLSDLYEMNKGGISGFKGENAVTSAILDVIQAKPDRISFTQGHGEMSTANPSPQNGLTALAQALHLRGFAINDIDLTGSGEIPAGEAKPKLIVIASPMVPFQPHEVEKLRHYLEQNNGRLLVFLQPGKNHGLDDFLHQWGLRSENMLVVEHDAKALTPEGDMIITKYADHLLTRSLAYSNLPVRFGPSRPVQTDETAPSDERRRVYQLLASSNNSWSTPNYLHPADRFDGVNDRPGPLSVAALAEESSASARAPDALGLPGGRLVVFGNADFIANQRFDYLGNSYLLLNCVNYLTNHETLLNLPPKPVQRFVLGMTRAQYIGLAWRLALLPAAFMVLGIGVFVLRSR